MHAIDAPMSARLANRSPTAVLAARADIVAEMEARNLAKASEDISRAWKAISESMRPMRHSKTERRKHTNWCASFAARARASSLRLWELASRWNQARGGAGRRAAGQAQVEAYFARSSARIAVNIAVGMLARIVDGAEMMALGV